MTYAPVLFRAALTMSAVIGVAAPLAAQPLVSNPTGSVNTGDNGGATVPQGRLPESIAQAPSDTAPPNQVFPLPPQSPTGEKAVPPPSTSPDLAPPDLAPGATPPPLGDSPAPTTESAPSSTTEPLPTPSAPSTGDTSPTIPTQPPAPPSAETAPAQPERQVLVSEVVVEGVQDDLVDKVYEAISTRPGQLATRSQLQVDINAIFATGYFSAVRAEPTDTPLGVRVAFIVQANPVLRSVQAAGNQALPQEKINEIFQPQYGKILNLRELQAGIKAVNQYYQDKGFVLGQVVGSSS
ncbi:MAG TPA: POTRA domain-containing protein [Stenomitos sp.]